MDEKRGIATRQELDALIADRKNDPPVPALNHPKPSWVLSAEDRDRVRMRMRERRIHYLERRLSGATQKMERDYERGS